MATPNVATNAILYRSATCRAAIRAANHSHWERVQWPPNELRAAQKVIALRSSGGVQMAYVRNQKAASEYLIATMARLFGARHLYGGNVLPTTEEGKSKVATERAAASSVLWTVVRDPIDTVLSGYMQLSHWPAEHDKLSPLPRWRQMPCSEASETGDSQTRSTARFDAFLDDLVAGRPLGYSFHHVYPQALKIDVHAGGLPLPLKAIGRLENLNADLTQIASRYGRVANVTIPPAVRAHSNAADPCSRIERTPQIMSKLCQLFEVDYACFPAYPRPAACTL